MWNGESEEGEESVKDRESWERRRVWLARGKVCEKEIVRKAGGRKRVERMRVGEGVWDGRKRERVRDREWG